MLILEKFTCDLCQVSLMSHQKCSSSKPKNFRKHSTVTFWVRVFCLFGLGLGVLVVFLKINQTCSLKSPV